MHAMPTIPIFAQAPPKPDLGASCNGCGVCCLLAPCPLGVLLSGRRTGACDALRWQDDGALYRCGAMSAPGAVLRARLPAALHFAVPALAWSLGRLAGRWVAAGDGCDCDAQLDDAPSDTSLP